MGISGKLGQGPMIGLGVGQVGGSSPLGHLPLLPQPNAPSSTLISKLVCLLVLKAMI